MNAIKHGMSARIPVLPGEDEAAFRRRVDDFLDALDPRDAVEVVLAEQAALASWKIERAERAEAARVAAALRAAEAAAGTEHLDEVAALGHWLLTDDLRGRQEAGKALFPFLSPDRHDPFGRGRGEPRHIVARLEATAEGCSWLRGQWARLGRRLERGHDWRTDELIVALQLRGQRPLGRDLIEWAGALEPVAADDASEVVAQARLALRIQFAEGLPGDPAARRAALLGLVEEERERLEAGHRRREAADRAELADRLAVDLTADGERMRRYQLDSDRKLHRALNSLLKLRRGERVGVVGDPSPDGNPDPAPEPVEVIEPRSGPADGRKGEVDAEVGAETEGDSLEDDALIAGGSPWSFGVDLATILEPERLPAPDGPTDPVPPEGGTPTPAGGKGAPPDPQHEPTPQNEPGPATRGEWVPQNDPTASAAGDQTPRNEPSPPAASDRIPRNEPTGSGRIAALSVSAIVLALVILLAARMSAAMAGPAAVPGGRQETLRDQRSGPTELSNVRARGHDPAGPTQRRAGTPAVHDT